MSPSPRGSRVYIVAEAGVNHNGSLARAKKMIVAAARAGADAVKFQTFVPEEVISRSAPMAAYQKRNARHETSQLEMVRKLELGQAEHRALVATAKEAGIDFLSTPFDLPSLEFLARGLRIRTIKIPSGEITNGPLLYRTGQLARRVILSTGMATLDEIESALSFLAAGFLKRKPGTPLTVAGRKLVAGRVTLLHCTTEYPAPMSELNLNAMATLRARFGTAVGFSDHSLGIAAAAAAAALGAALIEKHFTLDRNLPGPDHKASLEADELAAMVRQVRDVEAAMGSGRKGPTRSERKNMPIARKSLVARRAIAAGEPFTAENLTAKRPGNGVPPTQYWSYLGRRASRDYAPDELIKPMAPIP